MHFYRAMQPVQALTFDLDDTLYDNVPCMAKTEDEFMTCLQQHDGLQDFQFAEFEQFKQLALDDDPEIFHDVVIWREKALGKLFQDKQFHSAQAGSMIADIMDHFIYWRNQLTVPEETHQVLANLANKYPLAVISNGNADIEKIGLADYFQFALRAGPDGRSKPFPDIFHTAATQLAIPSQHVLHVGDNLYADVLGAINGQMQACWINIFAQDIYHLSDAQVLPHVEITTLAELNNLL